MDLNISFGIDTKVDAINRVLDAIGSVGINSEEEIDWNIDAASADKLIDSMSEEVQINMGKGWWFNRESFHKFSPDSVTGLVVLPNNTLSCLIKRGREKPLAITTRGTKMFDPNVYGYNMKPLVGSSGYIETILVVNLPFEDLPSSAKHTITNMARYWFVNDKEGDTTKLQTTREAAANSMSGLAAEDGRQRRRNMLNNPRVAYDMFKAGGVNNN